jgi:single-stranded-DNA-specific exonuclease
VVGEPDFATAVTAELERDLEAWPAAGRAGGSPERAVRDVRGGGIAGLLGDLVAGGAPVLAVTAHAAHRARALRDRLGGFAVTTWAAVEAQPELAAPYTHVVAVDPPPYPQLAELAGALPGEGWTHLAWGAPEQELARRVLAWELDLRAPLGEVYRALRAAAAGPAGHVEPEALASILRGSGAQPRSGAVAGRLLRVLGELELVALDPAAGGASVPPPPGRTQLERSPAFRFYGRRLAAGLAYFADPVVAAEPVAAAPQTAIAV